MTGKELLRALSRLPLEQLNQPVLMEQYYEGNCLPCRAVIFDPELQEVIILGKGPFDREENA